MAYFQCGKARQDAGTLPLAKPLQQLTHGLVSSNSTANKPIEIKVFSGYLGEVKLKMDGEGNNLNLIAKVNLGKEHDILVKVIDATTNALRPLEMRYSENYLQMCRPATIDLTANRAHYLALMTFGQAIARRESDKDKENVATYEIEQLQSDAGEVEFARARHPMMKFAHLMTLAQLKKARGICLVALCPVDALFHMQEFLQFLYSSTSEVGILGKKELICISGLPNVDNAFFTGDYMVLGNGEKQFYPLVSADVVGHEFTHGLVQGLAGLIYQGHSGALNEHFSDVMGVCYESWLYQKYNQNESKEDDILGTADWLMGEDLGVTMPYLRNFQDPELAQQPKFYKGKFYMDPNGNFDNGGVHVNSGLWNHCFFKVCAEKRVPMSKALTLWMQALRNMSNNSNFMHLRDLLIHFSSEEPQLHSVIRQCLDAVGMTTEAQSDQKGDANIAFPMPALPKPKLEVPEKAPAPPDEEEMCNGSVFISCPCRCHQKK
jgi:hypothetical protein